MSQITYQTTTWGTGQIQKLLMKPIGPALTKVLVILNKSIFRGIHNWTIYKFVYYCKNIYCKKYIDEAATGCKNKGVYTIHQSRMGGQGQWWGLDSFSAKFSKVMDGPTNWPTNQPTNRVS